MSTFPASQQPNNPIQPQQSAPTQQTVPPISTTGNPAQVNPNPVNPQAPPANQTQHQPAPQQSQQQQPASQPPQQPAPNNQDTYNRTFQAILNEMQQSDPSQTQPQQNQPAPQQPAQQQPAPQQPADSTQQATSQPTDQQLQQQSELNQATLVQMLTEMGVQDVNESNVQDRLREVIGTTTSTVSEATQLKTRVAQQQAQIEKLLSMVPKDQAQQAQQSQSNNSDASNLPRFLPEWREYLTEDGVPAADAPLEVQQAYRSITAMRDKQVQNPEEWMLDHIKALKNNDQFRELIAEVVKPAVGDFMQTQEIQREAEEKYEELSKSIFKKNPVTQQIEVDPVTGSPVYNELGEKIFAAATNELSRYGINPEDRSNEIHLIRAMHAHLQNTLATQSQQQTFPQQPQQQNQQPLSVEEQRRQNQMNLVNQNSQQTFLDPGTDQSAQNNVSSYGTNGVPQDQFQSTAPTDIRSRIEYALKKEGIGIA